MPVQTPGVDVADAVARRGDVLVVLSRGRLFTVDVSGRVASAAMPTCSTGRAGDAWCDEMLDLGKTVVVIGYSYARGETEVHLFDLGDDGRLTYRDTYQLRSNDFTAERQRYSARLVGGRLVLYTPLMATAQQWAAGTRLEALLPAMRRWTGRAEARFEPVVPADARLPARRDRTRPAERRAAHGHLVRRRRAANSTAPRRPSSAPAATRSTVRDAVYVWP